MPSALAVGAATGWPNVTVPEPAQNGYMVIAQRAADADLTSASKGGFDQLPGLTKGANTFIDFIRVLTPARSFTR